MFVDEAQDLSLIQWKLVRKIEEDLQILLLQVMMTKVSTNGMVHT